MRLYCLWEIKFERKQEFFLLFLCFWLLRKGMMEVLPGYYSCIQIGPFYNLLLVCLMNLNVLYLIQLLGD